MLYTFIDIDIYFFRLNENVKTSASQIERSFADRLAVQLTNVTDQLENHEKAIGELKQIVKQEKQLRCIAEQCLQDAQINNTNYQKV